LADIKNLSIFGNSDRGIKKIKEKTEKKQEKEPPVKVEAPENKVEVKKPIQSTNIIRGVGAPIKNHDQVYTTKTALKLSAITVFLTRILSEKYMAENTRDEILRTALNDYIKHHLTKEDKEDLLNDLEKELAIFRTKHPTNPSYDENGKLLKTPDEIELETHKYFIQNWGIKKY